MSVALFLGRYVLGLSRTYRRRLGFYAVITIWRQAAEYTKPIRLIALLDKGSAPKMKIMVIMVIDERIKETMQVLQWYIWYCVLVVIASRID